MATLEQLIADLSALKAQRGAERSVRSRGPNSEDEVVFKSDKEIATAIAALEQEIAVRQGTAIRTMSVRGWA